MLSLRFSSHRQTRRVGSEFISKSVHHSQDLFSSTFDSVYYFNVIHIYVGFNVSYFYKSAYTVQPAHWLQLMLWHFGGGGAPGGI